MTARRFARKRNTSCVAAEEVDVFLNPLQSDALVICALVVDGGFVVRDLIGEEFARGEEAEEIEAVGY